MNKKRCAFISVVVALMILLTGIVVYWLQENKESVSDRINRKASETDAVTETADKTDAESVENNDTSEDNRAVVGDNIFYDGPVKVELLSADVLEGDDISAETEYPVEYFQSQTLPVSNLLEDVTDWDSIWKEAPEVKEMQEAPFDAYTYEEMDEILARNQDVIDKYTYTKTMPQKVYFIKCRLTNCGTRTVTNTFPLEVTSVSDSGEMTAREDIVYFDKPIYTDGDERSMRYFFFRLAGGESLDCTIGFAVPQEFGENDRHYYGVRPINGEAYDPTTSPDFVDIDALPQAEK